MCLLASLYALVIASRLKVFDKYDFFLIVRT